MRWLWSGDGGRGGRLTRLTAAILTVAVLAVQLGMREDAPWRNFWWDTLQRQMPRDRGPIADAPAVIIAIDEETMSLYGEWPWPRSETAVVIQQAHAQGARVIVPDMILSQTDPQSPRQQAAFYRDRGMEAAARELDKLGHSDELFANVMRDTPTVLPLVGSPLFGTDDTAACDFLKPGVLVDPPDLAADLGLTFPDADPPLPEFQERVRGLAAIDFDSDRSLIVRRMNAVQTICEKPILLLGAEALRAARDGFVSTVRAGTFGLEVTLGEDGETPAPRFPTETDGTFWLHFGVVDPDRYIAAKDLFEEGFDPARLDGKIALLAVVDLGRVDERKSPLGRTIYGVEAHLQMLEQIVAQNFLRRPALVFWLEILTLVSGSVALAVLVPRMKPVQAVLAVGAGLAGLLGLGALLFALGILVDAISPVGGILIVALGAMASTLVEKDRERLRSEIDLERERANRAQLQGELDAAARIQTALLPPRRFERKGEIDLACYIDPARTVGGDFYDHFMVDDQHLFFLVADVSGKGADASQFMLLSKTLWKSVALRTGAPLDEIQLTANIEITRENTAMMFVTGLCGLYNFETRELTYSSAGHDSPYLFGDNRTPEQLDAFSGPPAGLMDGIDFPVGRVTLSPGDRLCIFTDGVSEAMDMDRELFGLERIETALGAAPTGLDSAGMVDHVVARVRRFTGDAEQSDDLTLMVITIPE